MGAVCLTSVQAGMYPLLIVNRGAEKTWKPVLKVEAQRLGLTQGRSVGDPGTGFRGSGYIGVI